MILYEFSFSFDFLYNVIEMVVDSDTVLDITGKRDPVHALLSARRGTTTVHLM